jgi:fatty-acyl-CoA synthase
MAQLSHVKGEIGTPLINEPIGQYFDRVCHENAHRLALIACHQNVRWTYSELQQRVDAFAAGLLALGLTTGDRVGIWAPNCWEWLVTQYATAKAGLVLVNINPAYRKAEVEYAINKVGCTALVMATQHKSSNYIETLWHLAPELGTTASSPLRAKRLPQLRWVITLGSGHHPGCLPFEDVVAAGASHDRLRLQQIAGRLTCQQPINIQFTSGTTGSPKGATLTHRNVLNNGFFVGQAIRLRPHERLCAPVPLYHCFGMVMANLACLTHGACVVYPAGAFNPVEVLQAVETERCAALYGVPTMFIAMLTHGEFGRFDLTSLRTGIMAGSPCPIEVMRQVVERMHLPEITIAYGMTETAPVSFQSSTDDPLERRVTTVGRVQPHLEVKIIGVNGVTVPRGEPGELCTRGYSVMLGYWNDPVRTAEALDHDAWMHTGDLATLDESGYCNIVGRMKDMVIRGGENIYPREIEEFLHRHPGIRDIQVIGVPDPKYGEELCAWIIPMPGRELQAEAVREFCRGQIAHYKIPRYVKFVETFPTTVTGKVQNFVMRDATMAELGLSAQATA